MIRLWAILSTVIVACAVFGMIVFVAIKSLPVFSLELIFGDTPPLAAILGEPVWDGLWTPISGTLRLLFLTGLFAVPTGLSLGIYTAAYAGSKGERRIISFLEALAGVPSIIVGLFGFVLILFLRKWFFHAGTGLLLSAFCLAVMVLPVLAVNTYTSLKGVSQSLWLTASSLGMPKSAALFRLILPAAWEGVVSGLLLAAGRSAEDTAVILITGAVAGSVNPGFFGKFEALPFFIYYMGANYRDGFQLSQVFAAACVLLGLTLTLLGAAYLLKSGRRA